MTPAQVLRVLLPPLVEMPETLASPAGLLGRAALEPMRLA